MRNATSVAEGGGIGGVSTALTPTYLASAWRPTQGLLVIETRIAVRSVIEREVFVRQFHRSTDTLRLFVKCLSFIRLCFVVENRCRCPSPPKTRRH
jgi:hypothetical protein